MRKILLTLSLITIGMGLVACTTTISLNSSDNTSLPSTNDDNSETNTYEETSTDSCLNGHDYQVIGYSWNNDNTEVTATKTCTNDPSHIVNETVDTSYEVITAPTCEEEGTGRYTATFADNDFTTQIKDIVIPIIGHDYRVTGYVWNNNNTEVTATKVCQNDSTHTMEEVTNTSYEVIIPATCEVDGLGRYTASFLDQDFSTQTKDVVLSATGHDMTYHPYAASTCEEAGSIEYWSCSNCNKKYYDENGTQEITGATSIEPTGHSLEHHGEISPTCENDGTYAYDECSICHKKYIDNILINNNNELVNPKLNHDYDFENVTYTWNKQFATATVICKNDSNHIYQETIEAESSKDGDVITYTATFIDTMFGTTSKEVYDHEHNYTVDIVDPTCTSDGYTIYSCLCGESYQDTVIPAIGHDYQVTGYVWNSTNTQVTATKACSNDATHVINETVNSSYQVVTESTCTIDGTGRYTANFVDKDFNTQTKDVVIPATGHNYQVIGYSWNNDNTEVTATKTCTNDPSHIVNETVDTSYEVITAPTCEEEGTGRYTATFADNDFTTQIKDIVIPIIGHDYRVTGYVWNNNNTEVTATKVCQNDHTHIINEIANTDNEVIKEATCEEEGTIRYTTSFIDSDFTTQTKDESIPATGHNYEVSGYSWNSNNTKTTAIAVCNNDGCNEQIVETVNTTYEVITPSTRLNNGVGRYTATFSNDLFETQYKDVEIPSQSSNWLGPRTPEITTSTTSLEMWMGDSLDLVATAKTFDDIDITDNITFTLINGSTATLNNNTFIPQAAGDYIVRITAYDPDDNTLNSYIDINITVKSMFTNLAGNAILNDNTNSDQELTVTNDGFAPILFNMDESNYYYAEFIVNDLNWSGNIGFGHGYGDDYMNNPTYKNTLIPSSKSISKGYYNNSFWNNGYEEAHEQLDHSNFSGYYNFNNSYIKFATARVDGYFYTFINDVYESATQADVLSDIDTRLFIWSQAYTAEKDDPNNEDSRKDITINNFVFMTNEIDVKNKVKSLTNNNTLISPYVPKYQYWDYNSNNYDFGYDTNPTEEYSLKEYVNIKSNSTGTNSAIVSPWITFADDFTFEFDYQNYGYEDTGNAQDNRMWVEIRPICYGEPLLEFGLKTNMKQFMMDPTSDSYIYDWYGGKAMYWDGRWDYQYNMNDTSKWGGTTFDDSKGIHFKLERDVTDGEYELDGVTYNNVTYYTMTINSIAKPEQSYSRTIATAGSNYGGMSSSLVRPTITNQKSAGFIYNISYTCPELD